MMAKDIHAMNTATQELADLTAAHQDLADDNRQVQGQDRHRASRRRPRTARAGEATPHPQADRVATAGLTPAPALRPIGYEKLYRIK
jgi:hypothetical protein